VGGVFPDSGKLLELIDRPREMLTMSSCDDFCGGVKISSAVVVTKTLPGV